MPLPSEPTRLTLLSRIQNHEDHGAWKEFEEQYRDLILGYALRRGLQRNDAEDVLQVVMSSLVTLFRRGFEYHPKRGKFRNYLGRVVANAVSRAHAKPNRPALHLDTELEQALESSNSITNDLEWEDEWVQHHFRRAIWTLRRTFEEQSVAMFELMVRGDSIATIATQFQTTPDAVYKVKQRIRNRMEVLIASQVAEEEHVDDTAVE